MSDLPHEIWYEICQKLHLPDQLRFSSTDHKARNILGNYETQRTRYWSSIFKSFEWAEAFNLQHLTPGLVFPDKEGSYVYLFMLRRKDEGVDNTSGGKLEEAGISLFKMIRDSLRSCAPGENPWEMQFENFTLNLSSILLPNAPKSLICPQLFNDPTKKNVEIAVYGGSIKEVKLDFLHGEFAFSKFPKDSEFGDLLFIRHCGSGLAEIYLRSLDLR